MLAARANGWLSLPVWRRVIRPSREVSSPFKAYTMLLCLLPRDLFSQHYSAVALRPRSRHTRGGSPALALSQLQPTRFS